jgi:hypothetical protein
MEVGSLGKAGGVMGKSGAGPSDTLASAKRRLFGMLLMLGGTLLISPDALLITIIR